MNSIRVGQPVTTGVWKQALGVWESLSRSQKGRTGNEVNLQCIEQGVLSPRSQGTTLYCGAGVCRASKSTYQLRLLGSVLEL